MKETKPNIVFGSFGFGNVGDEAVPEAFGAMAKAAGYSADVQALTRFENGLMDGVIYRDDAVLFLHDFSRRDVFLVGGGIFEPGENACFNRLYDIHKTARNFDIMPFAVSVEPGVRFSWRDKRRMIHTLNSLETVCVRDELSANVLSGLVPNANIETIGDIVLWLEPKTIPPEVNIPERYIVVSLASTWTDNGYYNWIVEELSALSNQHDVEIVLLPISFLVGDDIEQHTKILNRLLDERVRASLLDFSGIPHFENGWIAEIYRNSELVVSSRLHGCVISYAQGTPFVALGYHPKLKGFCKTVLSESSLLPKTLPDQQDRNAYGFDFESLNLKRGQLVERASHVMGGADFSAKEYYKRKQLLAFQKLKYLAQDKY